MTQRRSPLRWSGDDEAGVWGAFGWIAPLWTAGLAMSLPWLDEHWTFVVQTVSSAMILICAIYVLGSLATSRSRAARLAAERMGSVTRAQAGVRTLLVSTISIGAMAAAGFASIVMDQPRDPLFADFADAWFWPLLLGWLLVVCAVSIAVLQLPDVVTWVFRRRHTEVPRPWSAAFLGTPLARIEVDPRGLGRTRLRIAAPAPLPMVGIARAPVHVAHRLPNAPLGRQRWEGRGAEAAYRWGELLEPGLALALRAAVDSRFRLTLSAAGLVVQLPGLVPTDEALERLRRAGSLLARAIERASQEPPPEGVVFATDAAVRLAGQCACCWEEMAPEEARTDCAACGAVQHTDCFEWTGGCGRFACSGAAPAE